MFQINREYLHRYWLLGAVFLTIGTAKGTSVYAEESLGTSTVSNQISVQILSTTVVDYEARVLSATDAINTQP